MLSGRSHYGVDEHLIEKLPEILEKIQLQIFAVRDGTYLARAIRGLLQTHCYSIFWFASWMQGRKMHLNNVRMTEAVRYHYHRGGQDHKENQSLN